MSFFYSYAPSSRIKSSGPRKNKGLPSGIRKRTTPTKSKASRRTSTPDLETANQDAGLESHAVLLQTIAPGLGDSSITSILEYVSGHMFEDIPERASGMNSIRIAEVLNYRLRIPPVASVPHIHALRSSPTSTEREIASLVSSGDVGKIVIPGRGFGADSHGNGLALLSKWQEWLDNHADLGEAIKKKYMQRIRGQPATHFTPAELRLLMKSGFLTGGSLVSCSETFFAPILESLKPLSSIANAPGDFASGSVDAAASRRAMANISGGAGAAERMQSRGTKAKTSKDYESSFPQTSYAFTLPNMGIYMKLLTSAREYLVSLVVKSGPSRSTTVNHLKERWNAGSNTNSKEVLPGRTKKWKEFHGLKFEWVLAECLGAGLLECFKTRSVGTGVRMI